MSEALICLLDGILVVVSACWAGTTVDVVWMRLAKVDESVPRLGALTLALLAPGVVLTVYRPWAGVTALVAIAITALLVATKISPAQDGPMSIVDPADSAGSGPLEPELAGRAATTPAAADGADVDTTHGAEALSQRWPDTHFAVVSSSEAIVVSWTDGPAAGDVARTWADHHPGEVVHTRRSYTPEAGAQLLLDLVDQGHWDLVAWPTARIAAVGDRSWLPAPSKDAQQMAIVAGETNRQPLTYPLWRALLAVRPHAADRPEFADPVLEATLSLSQRWPETAFAVSLQIDTDPILTVSWDDGPDPDSVRERLCDALEGVSIWTDRHGAEV